MKPNPATPDTKIRTEAAGAPPPLGRPIDAGSFAQQVARLEVGGTAARAIRLPAESTTWPLIIETKGKLRNVVSGQLNKVRAKPECEGHTHSTTVGHYNAENGDTIVALTVTRLS